MLREKSVDPEYLQRDQKDLGSTLSIVYTQLPDGRMAPIAEGGLVELALSELGAHLVDVSEDPHPHVLYDLN